ncbi:MAG: phosphomannomutase/phosphoglucomutase [Chloroflexus sp.]|uniref:phosphomannomutase/phosphoglucomutase n=1 Tax=Chloroflexus sp. Y-396-1 TaxID=867845 RepID=UPI00048B58CC|nr:phosphomannomutase/phosphoglucomutase [Chloroflexus sp. Y-396-1]MBO9312676.1 phosphomannomutase/phosphoglucomutase [Chloroflexus sp.]MBO9316045.1 phosphomannomutase/phosphoglucomutase [Chloroflexus sp.]MBO9318609.1 phosphomannomutase/phosphoglucomutase [Chloroflexus sp.]MBO9374143.1 phosphomannomutase/phosphoglucomutase [Chloroflexus sp.]
MQVNPAIFKAYDIRGIYPTELNEEIAYLIGRAFVTFLGADTVIVGRDMRTSGPVLFDAVTRGIMDQGADVVDIGMVSTDQYYFACTQLGFPGMMVTASHNPKQYNGFKMVRRMPYLLSGDEGIQDLRRLVESEAFPTPTRRGQRREYDFKAQFVQKVLSLIDVEAIKPLKVIVDTGNGMVGPILQEVYSHLPIQLTGMYLDPDGTLPNHGLDPLMPENRAELQQRVKDEGADIGFAFDGDGDRFFAIDDRGEFISGDFLTAILGRYLLEKEPGAKIIYDVRASWAVPDEVRAAGGIPLIERVGHAFIKRRMANEDAIFAGEVSGHYYFKAFAFADSGIIPSLYLLEMLSKRGVKMSELLSRLESRYFISGEINSRVSDVAAKLNEIAERYSDGKIERIDGISVSYDTWHFNVRGSNTEPLIRLNLESIASRAEMEARRDEVLAIIRS